MRDIFGDFRDKDTEENERCNIQCPQTLATPWLFSLYTRAHWVPQCSRVKKSGAKLRERLSE